jgi:hypothetical protein
MLGHKVLEQAVQAAPTQWIKGTPSQFFLAGASNIFIVVLL